MITRAKNRVNTCTKCDAEYAVTIMAYTPVRVMISCCCNVQFLSYEEAKQILSEAVEEIGA